MAEETKVAVVNQQTDLVENIAVVTDGDGSTPAEGFLFVPSDAAAIGDTWDGSQIIKPPLPIVEITAQETLSVGKVSAATDTQTLGNDLEALTARVAAIEAKLGL